MEDKNLIPILYNSTETEYLTDGLGQLFDVQSCIVSEEANGSFTLDMEYPKNGSLVNHILKGNQILAKPNDIDKEHAFRILEVDKSTSNSTISITATSITNDEGRNIVRAIKVSNKNAADAMNMIKNNLVLKSRFEYLSDITTIKSFENGHMTPLSAVIGDENSLYNFYGGELKRTNTSIQLLQRRGRDKVTTIEKGKNASGITHNISYNGKYTSILPYVALTGLTSTEKKNLDYYQVRNVELGSGLTVVLTRTRNKSVIFQCDMNLTSEFKEDGVYKLAKNMLIHRSGTEFEDMYWIDLDEIRVIAEETNSLVKKRIIYSNKIIKKIQSCKNIITIHSHPDSFPPSIADFNSNYDHNYVVGIVACHNGKLYMYSANERINEDYYKLVVEGFLKIGYNEEEAQIKALENLQINFDIKFKEVTDYDCI